MSVERPQGFLPGRHLLDSVGNGGFRFGDMSHRGSILILPSGFHAWAAETLDDVTAEALALVFAEARGIDLLLVGTGDKAGTLPEALRWTFRELGLRFDAMATPAAARTYNVLAAEGRRVGAALLAIGSLS